SRTKFAVRSSIFIELKINEVDFSELCEALLSVSLAIIAQRFPLVKGFFKSFLLFFKTFF
ncbi:MAG: hypothetical protein IJX76_09335, partial [Clostridia bacterium]|nr:hypothetical protein [Clostridia bacterium]